MPFAPWIAIGIVLVFAAASFFFSLAETALFSLSKWQAAQISRNNPRHGGILEQLLAHPQGALATLVLGNTFANSAMLATALWMALHDNWPFTATIVAVLITTLVLCEVLPKTLSVRRPEKWALRVARPVQLLTNVAGPLNRVAEGFNLWVLRHTIPKSIQPYSGITEEDYHELLDMAFQQGALERSERDIILQIIRLDRRTAKDVMRPRSQMKTISDDLSIEQMIAVAKKYRHRRLPIYDETPDTIVGMLNTRALLLDPAIDLADAIEFPSFVPESMNLLQLLKSLQRQRRGMAIVLDEFGGTAGLITVEDILEEIIGKIRVKPASENLVLQKMGPAQWRVSGSLRLNDFKREYPALPDYEGVDTLGGLFLSAHQIVPSAGETSNVGSLKLTALVTDERRIRELLVEVIKP